MPKARISGYFRVPLVRCTRSAEPAAGGRFRGAGMSGAVRPGRARPFKLTAIFDSGNVRTVFVDATSM